jgi:Xaa-Pro aminopeptidase
VTQRTEKLLELLPGAGVDALLVTTLVNVRYLTGYTGSNGLAVIGPDVRAFATDFRYVEQAAEEVDPEFDRLRVSQDLVEAVPEVLDGRDIRLGFEEANLTVRDHGRLRERLPDQVELVGVQSLVERLRAVKSPEELDRIRTAAELADAAFTHLISEPFVGRTERELATALEFEMLRLGAERPSFEAIVAAGPHGALPHARPRDVQVSDGQLVVIDWGAQLDGYCSDCTRTVLAGSPSGRDSEIYDLVLEAQLRGLEAIAPGVAARDVDSVARQTIESCGHGEHFGHGLGHGVGLEVHEAPRLSQRSEAVLEAGNVVTVEPGVYLPGELGVRIEDLVVVTDEGCGILSPVSKDLTIVG